MLKFCHWLKNDGFTTTQRLGDPPTSRGKFHPVVTTPTLEPSRSAQDRS